MRSLTLAEMQDLAEKQGGHCLSTSYRNSYTKLLWRCRLGHRWRAIPKAVKQGHWCDKCFDDRRRGSISRIDKIAANHGGQCVSRSYPNVKTPLRLRCAEGHEWHATGNSILRGSWCRRCAGKAKHTLVKAREVARERGGRCLSRAYENAHAKLRWRCSEKHEWVAPLNGVLSGRWCPYCSAFLRERLVRSIFEQIFRADFPRIRPEWLRSKTGFKMELDGCNDKLRLAFEHHGEQHYAIVERFSKSGAVLRARQRDDALKRKLCRINKIRLIEIPYTVPVTKLTSFVIAQCVRRGVRVSDRAVSLDKAYPMGEIKALQVLTAARGGRCLSKSYKGSEIRLDFQCKAGHRWGDYPWRVRAGAWCGKCRVDGRRVLRAQDYLERLRKLAASKGGRCLAKTYHGSQRTVALQCARGHKWLARPANVLGHGSWCPKCWRS